MLLRWTQTRYAIKLQMRPLLWRRGCAGGEAPAAIVGGAHPAAQVYKYFDAAKKALADWMDLSSLEGASMDDVRTEGRKPMAQMV